MRQRIGSANWMTRTQNEQENEKRLRKNEEGLREIQDNMRHNNIHIIMDTRKRRGRPRNRKPV